MSELSLNQIAALAIMMALGREVSNKDFQELAGFTLTGKDRTGLVKHGLITERTNTRPYAFELSPDGWKRAPELLADQPPRKGAAAGALMVLLAGVHRAAARYSDGARGMFAAATEPHDPPSPTPDLASPAAARDLGAAIETTYRSLAKAPAAWVSLADIRDAVGGARADVDAALKKLAVRPGVRLVPIANLKTLDERDRRAALRFGGEDNHALAIEA